MQSSFLLSILLAANLHAASVTPADPKLDMKTVQVNFREGELEAVKTLLESFLRKQGASATRDEKIFAYKYLGVIYAANQEERTRAESYFNQLLPLAPNIELADMYVSHNILEIFDKVKREYLHTQDYRAHFDSFGNPKAPEKNGPATKQAPKTAQVEATSNNAWVWWTVAGVATVGAGAAFWAVESGHSSSPANHVTGGL